MTATRVNFHSKPPSSVDSAEAQDPTPYRFSFEQYYQLGEAGFFHDQRVELIDGKIYEMPPQKELHFATLNLAAKAISSAFTANVWVRTQGPLRIADRSEPEPDIAVVAGSPRDYINRAHPTTAQLVVEISDTTLEYDRHIKTSLYAAGGILDYWIVNLVDRQVEVYREIQDDASALLGKRYSAPRIFRAGEVIIPLGASTSKIAVNDLLP
jgi:Uma2 family endonuclease